MTAPERGEEDTMQKLVDLNALCNAAIRYRHVARLVELDGGWLLHWKADEHSEAKADLLAAAGLDHGPLLGACSSVRNSFLDAVAGLDGSGGPCGLGPKVGRVSVKALCDLVDAAQDALEDAKQARPFAQCTSEADASFRAIVTLHNAA